MATSPTAANGKRKGGPRPKKDKVVYLLFKGSIDDVLVALTPEQVLDMTETDASWQRRKVVIPAKARPASAPTA